MKTSRLYRSQNLRIVHGDLFDFVEKYIHEPRNGTSIIVPHVCNNVNLFGAGFAAAVATHYPAVKSNYHLLGNKQVLGYTQFVTVANNKDYEHKLIIANMISQNGVVSNANRRPLNYAALVKSMVSVSTFIHQHFDNDNPVQIHAPKFGCGLAGGEWGFVSELIKDIWGNYSVFVYQK